MVAPVGMGALLTRMGMRAVLLHSLRMHCAPLTALVGYASLSQNTCAKNLPHTTPRVAFQASKSG
jgi:hypothetical protein